MDDIGDDGRVDAPIPVIGVETSHRTTAGAIIGDYRPLTGGPMEATESPHRFTDADASLEVVTGVHRLHCTNRSGGKSCGGRQTSYEASTAVTMLGSNSSTP